MFEIIQTIAEQYGRGILADGRKVLAFHADMAPMEKKEHLMLKYLIECDGHTALLKVLNAPSREQEQAMNELGRKMTAQVLVSEAVAQEIIAHYWKAIGGMLVTKNSTKDSEPQEYVSITMKRDPHTGTWSGAHSGTAKPGRANPVIMGICAVLVAAVLFFAATGSRNEKPTESGNHNEQVDDMHGASEMEQVADPYGASEMEQKEVLEAVLSYEAKGNYEEAIVYLNNHSAAVSANTELQTKLHTYTEKYRSDVINEAASAYQKNGYQAAVSVLRSAQKVLPRDAAISSELARYTAAAPVSLLGLDCTKQGEYIEVGPSNSSLCKDVNGNTYANSGVICLDEYKSGKLHDGDSLRSITYYLGQNYDILTGVLFRPYTTLSFGGDWATEGRVEIYGDGVLLYEGRITQKTYDPVSIQVGVSGVRELTLVFRGAMGFETGDYGMYNWYSKCCLAELMVEKEL